MEGVSRNERAKKSAIKKLDTSMIAVINNVKISVISAD